MADKNQTKQNGGFKTVRARVEREYFVCSAPVAIYGFRCSVRPT